MRQGDFTARDIEQLQRHLEGKRAGHKEAAEVARRTATASFQPHAQAARGGTVADYEPRTQAAMNLVAAAQVVDVETALQIEIERLRLQLDHDQMSLFIAAHEHWERFKAAQAEYVASQYEGGSIQPLIRSSEINALTTQRLAQVASDLREREQW
jgi:uncharacterized protein YecT (DUF1311 family)